MITRTLEDGTVVESMFLIRYDKKDEEGNWIQVEEIGKEDAKATFDYVEQFRNRDDIRNVTIYREDAL